MYQVIAVRESQNFDEDNADSQEVLDDVVDVEVESGYGLLKGLLDVADVFLKQFGQDGEVLVAEPDFVDVRELLPQHRHQLVDVAQDVLVLVLAHQWLLLV